MRAIVLVSASSALQLILLFGYQMLLASRFGAQAEMDAYIASTTLPTVVSALLMSSLGNVIVPVFIANRERDALEDAWRFTSTFLNWLVVLLSTIAALLFLFPGAVVKLLSPGLTGEVMARAELLMRIQAVQLLATSLVSFFVSLHYANGRFFAVAAYPVVGLGVTILIFLALHRSLGILSAALAAVAGSICQIALLGRLMVRDRRYRFSWNPAHPQVRHGLSLLVPLLAGSLVARADPIVDRYLASSMPTGAISHLGYAERLIAALLLIGSSGIGATAFPAFAAKAALADTAALRAELGKAIRFLIFLLVPLGAGLILFPEPAVHFLLERGVFKAADTAAVSLLVRTYAGVFLGGAIGAVLAPCFYALHDTRTPAIIGTVGFVVGVLLKVVLSGPLGAVGITIGASIYYLLNVGLEVLLLTPRIGPLQGLGIKAAMERCVIAVVPAVLLAGLILRLELPAAVPLSTVVGGTCYLLVACVMGEEHSRRLLSAGVVRLGMPWKT